MSWLRPLRTVLRRRDLLIRLEALVRNVRQASRLLWRNPVFALTVVLTLALGIGANTAVFSVLDAVLLRPLPYPDPDRLVRLTQANDRTSDTGIAPPRLEDWNERSTAFDAIAGYYVEDVSETSGDVPERLRRATVTPRFLYALGIAPALGRDFVVDEHRYGGQSAVLISERYWRRRFNADPDVLGRTVRIGTMASPVVGVMPAGFGFPERDVDLWIPVSVDAPYAQSRQSPWYSAVGRLLPGATLDVARADMSAVQSRLGDDYPDTDRDISVQLLPLRESQVGSTSASLWLLFGAVTVLLLIACTNIVAVLLSRAAHRRAEIALRRSLGASRSAVAMQLLAEVGVLAFAGGVAGLVIAVFATRILRAAAPDLPRFDEIAIDGRVLLYTLASTLVVALLCGLLPAIGTSRGSDSMRESTRTLVSTRQRVRWFLVGAQVAFSVTLLAGAGLLVRSLDELSKVERGFESERVLSFRMSGSWGETADYASLIQRVDATIEALRAMPGVEAAATTGWTLPGVPAHYSSTFELVEGGGPVQPLIAERRAVSPEYFETMRIPMLEGEVCRRRNAEAGVPAGADVIVNRAFATQYLSGWSSAVGLSLRTADTAEPVSRIVGVAGNARERGLDRDAGPTVYYCNSAPNPTPYFLVRTGGEAAAVGQGIRMMMKDLEPLRSVYDIAPLEERIGDAFAENRLRTVLLTLFAATALALACVGLYGTLSYNVSLRRREIGLRLALGALRREIARQLLVQALGIVAIACAFGMAMSLASARLLSSMLYGVSPTDPVTLAGVIGIVSLVATLAVLVPAVRAAYVEPMKVLRED